LNPKGTGQTNVYQKMKYRIMQWQQSQVRYQGINIHRFTIDFSLYQNNGLRSWLIESLSHNMFPIYNVPLLMHNKYKLSLTKMNIYHIVFLKYKHFWVIHLFTSIQVRIGVADITMNRQHWTTKQRLYKILLLTIWSTTI